MKKMKPAEKAALIEWIAFISIALFVYVLHSNFQSSVKSHRATHAKIQDVNPDILKSVSDQFYSRNH